MRYDGTFSRLSKGTDIFDWSRIQHRSIEKEMHGTKVDTEDLVLLVNIADGLPNVNLVTERRARSLQCSCDRHHPL